MVDSRKALEKFQKIIKAINYETSAPLARCGLRFNCI